MLFDLLLCYLLYQTYDRNIYIYVTYLLIVSITILSIDYIDITILRYC